MAECIGTRFFEPLSSQGRDSSIYRWIPKTSFVEIDDRFICPNCGDILRDPVQTPCGHRMCERCSEALCEGGSPVQCPAFDKEDPCQLIDKRQVFRDASARREIAELPVFCSNALLGCTVTVPWKSLEIHVESECPETVMECPYKCGVRPMKRQELLVHKTSCKMKPHECNFKDFGCTFVIIQHMDEYHLKESGLELRNEIDFSYTSGGIIGHVSITTSI